ncbi:MAG: tetratricopeptide repeat protein [Opitutaceae bacterium]
MSESDNYQLEIKQPEGGEALHLYIDGRRQHALDPVRLAALVDSARVGSWRIDPSAGVHIGTDLYKLLDGSGGCISEVLDKYATSDALELYFDMPSLLGVLPVELLAKDGDFLQQNSNRHIIRGTRDRRKHWEVEDRALKVLFMAASPLELENKTLSFEREEETIQKATEKWPVELAFDDLGSLESLQAIIEEGQGYDVVHLSGHAVVHPELGPVFCFEDEGGGLDYVTPIRLYKAIAAYPPKIIFLSGCETGKDDKVNDVASFARQMVELGVPAAMGWALSVGDFAATRFVAPFYEYLSLGKTVADALKYSRAECQQSYAPWPLLRVHTVGASLRQSIVKRRAGRVVPQARKATYRLLDGHKVEVLETGFVGRRRHLQAGIRALKTDTEHCGFLIHGAAGLGKSCLAGRLIDHLRRADDWPLLVFKGTLHVEKILQELETLFRDPKWMEGRDVYARCKDQGFESLMCELFASVFRQHQAILYFDDFEDNLEQFGDSWRVRSESLEVVRSLLRSVDLAHGCSKLLMTSRYLFELADGQKDLVPTRLITDRLASMRGADLQKKLNQFPETRQAKNTELETLFKEYSGGNPRVMDWLHAVVEESIDVDIDELRDVLEEKREEYIVAYLSEIIATNEGDAFVSFLSAISVWNAPVPEAALNRLFSETDGRKRWLERGLNLTLIEVEIGADELARYAIHPLIRERYRDKLSDSERSTFNQICCEWYRDWLNEHSDDWGSRREAVIHAVSCKSWELACEHARVLGNFLQHQALFPAATEVFERVWKSLPESEQLSETSERSSFLNDYAQLLQATNRLSEAEPLMRRALAIDESSYGDSHPNVAIQLNNLASLLQATNRLSEAEPLMRRALAIFESSLGYSHPNVAIQLNNLASLLKATNRLSEAEPLMRRGLAVEESSYGDSHPNVAIQLNNLAQLLQATNRLSEAEPLMRRALAIDESSYGDSHPKVAIRLNNLAQLLKATNRLSEAEPLMRRALAIFESSYGDSHPNVAIQLNNLAQLLQATNRLSEAEPLMRRALAIDESSYGDSHPKVAIRLNNLAQLLQATNRLSEAEPLMRRALLIDESSYGESHPVVATRLNNLASLLQATNRLSEAEPLMRRALAIFESSLGYSHPNAATQLNNLAQLLKATNRLSEAEPLMRRALLIDESSYGDSHPDVAIDLNNLAQLLQEANRLSEAEPLMSRHLIIFRKFGETTGHPHPHFSAAIQNYWSLLKEMNLEKDEVMDRLAEASGVSRDALIAHFAQFE